VRFSHHARVLQQQPVTLIPNRLDIGGRIYREDIDISTEDAFRLMQNLPVPPRVIPPTTAEYLEIYAHLSKTCEGVLSIHPSRELSKSWQNARDAAQQASSSSCPIVVIDSRSICAAQGMLVRYATQLIGEGLAFDDMVNQVRSAADRIYAIYCVETLEYLHHNGIISESRAILGAMLGIKPIIGIEEGKLAVIEKVRTRTQLIEQLVEFVTEFTDLEDVLILQSRTQITEQTRIIQDRLSLEFVGRHFPFANYSPTMACYIGTDAVGVVVFENISAVFDDYSDDDW